MVPCGVHLCDQLETLTRYGMLIHQSALEEVYHLLLAVAVTVPCRWIIIPPTTIKVLQMGRILSILSVSPFRAEGRGRTRPKRGGQRWPKPGTPEAASGNKREPNSFYVVCTYSGFGRWGRGASDLTTPRSSQSRYRGVPHIIIYTTSEVYASRLPPFHINPRYLPI